MVVFDFFQSGDMRAAVEDKFGVHFHIHDTCGGLYYSFDEEPSEEIIEYIREYVAEHEKGADILLSKDRLSFTLTDKSADNK